MFDIHAHLHDDVFDADRDEVVARAFTLGVEKIITIGTDVKESRRAVACAEQYEGVYASVGIHPHFFNEIIEKEIPNSKFQIPNKIQNSNHKIQIEIEELKMLVTHEKVVAIGECGLDYFTRQSTESSQCPTINTQQKEIQKEGFIAQIELAEELQLPLIIHTRPSLGSMDAYEDVLDILSDSQFQILDFPFILHCYMGDTEVTRRFLELSNVYFSFTGNITYPVKKIFAGTKNDLTETVRLIPIERIFAETDCPYLAPVPYRGKRNEPSYVPLVATKIADIHGLSAESVENMMTMSGKKIFGL